MSAHTPALAERLERLGAELLAAAEQIRRAPAVAVAPADDSPAGRTASNASRAAVLHGRLAAALGRDLYSTVSASVSTGYVQVSATVALAAARASVALLPGGEVKVRRNDNYLWIETTGVGINQGIEIVAPVPIDDQAEARAWLAELGVEVTA